MNEQDSKRESILKDIFSVMNVKKDLEKKKLEEALECLEKTKKKTKGKFLTLLEKKCKFLFIKLVEA